MSKPKRSAALKAAQERYLATKPALIAFRLDERQINELDKLRTGEETLPQVAKRIVLAKLEYNLQDTDALK